MSRTIEDLRQKQGLPLSTKVLLTQSRIRQWVNEYGMDGVYVSFSGGKDSTVLCHIIDNMYPNNNIPKVFINTGLEYPEIVSFVQSFENVEIIKPEMNFKQVIKTYGYPFISKEVSECVWGSRNYLADLRAQTDRQHSPRYSYFYRKLCGIGEYDGLQNAKRQGRREPSSGTNARDAHAGQPCDASGSYP